MGIRKECHVTQAVMRELRKTIEDSEILKEDDNHWPAPDRVGRQELEVVCGKRAHLIHYIEDWLIVRCAGVQGPRRLEGLLLLGAGPQVLRVQLDRPPLSYQAGLSLAMVLTAPRCLHLPRHLAGRPWDWGCG